MTTDDEIAEIERTAYARTWGKSLDGLASAIERVKAAVLAEIEKLAKRLRLL